MVFTNCFWISFSKISSIFFLWFIIWGKAWLLKEKLCKPCTEQWMWDVFVLLINFKDLISGHPAEHKLTNMRSKDEFVLYPDKSAQMLLYLFSFLIFLLRYERLIFLHCREKDWGLMQMGPLWKWAINFIEAFENFFSCAFVSQEDKKSKGECKNRNSHHQQSQFLLLNQVKSRHGFIDFPVKKQHTLQNID